VTISAGQSIRVGARVLMGSGVLITDSDHHPVHVAPGMRRRFLGLPEASQDRPVVIGDDVFIGARSIILKGASIGDGAVIGSGSIVTGTIPPGCVAAGNPCRVISRLQE
jgi:acetyltransferase-like isoleucine patch superfamily enzyme